MVSGYTHTPTTRSDDTTDTRSENDKHAAIPHTHVAFGVSLIENNEGMRA